MEAKIEELRKKAHLSGGSFSVVTSSEELLTASDEVAGAIEKVENELVKCIKNKPVLNSLQRRKDTTFEAKQTTRRHQRKSHGITLTFIVYFYNLQEITYPDQLTMQVSTTVDL